MSIIKHGDKWHKYDCNTCGCVWEETQTEEEPRCPECGSLIVFDQTDYENQVRINIQEA
jgi:DNA-directed RNA polymerase subunit RPC12/RpoP